MTPSCRRSIVACIVLIAASGVGRGDDKPAPTLPPGFVNEAPLPEGFPVPGEVGEVIEKEYPVIRSYSATGSGAFMQCFGYLSKHKHEMTAPVVMESSATGQVTPAGRFGTPIAVERMHFLLGKNSLDAPKTEGTVTVADMPKLRVLSVAFQGNLTPDEVKAAESKLDEKLKTHPEWQEAGPIRVLGYNSPFVARAKQYHEIQKPIRDQAQ